MKQTSRARGRRLLATALLTAALLTATALATPATAEGRPFEEMCEELQAEAASFDGRISFVVHDLTGGVRCERNPDEIYITASLYKLVVLAEAHRQQEEGLFSFDERILGLLAGDAIRSMIQVSSNNTARALLGRLGLDAVAALPAQLGMNDTILRGEDYTTTASDIAHFFLQLEARQLISPEADQAMLDLLLRQSIRDRIPALLPSNVPIAHKTGRLDRSAHDAGIIYAPGGTYLLVLLTEGSPSQNWNPGHEAIRQLAALSYTAYGELPAPTPTPAATPAPTPTPTPSATPTPSPQPTASPTPAPMPTPTPTPSPTPTAAPTPQPTATETPSPTPSATPAPTATETPSPSATETPSPVVSGGGSGGTPPTTPPAGAADAASIATPSAAAAAAPNHSSAATPAVATPQPASRSFGLLPAGLLALAVVLSIVSLELLVPQWRGQKPATSP